MIETYHNPPEQPARRTYTVQEAGCILGLGRGAAFRAAKSGQLPTIRIGRRILVPRAALEKLLESSQQREGAA